MKHRLLLATIIGLAANSSQAATLLGFDVGAYVWATDLKGSANNVHFEGDKETNMVIFAAIEHPLPFVPNVRLSHSDISQTVDNAGDIDANHTDATLYYEVLDNWVSLDLGLAARKHDGKAKSFGGSTDKINSALGMAYAKVQFDIPATGVGIGAELYQGKGSGDEKVSDINVFVNYNIVLGFNVGAGYRRLNTDLEIANEMVNLQFDGAYLAAFYHF